MAITLNGTPTTQRAASTTLSVTLPAGVANNDIVLVLVAASAISGNINIIPPAGYTQVPNCLQEPVGGAVGSGVWYHVWQTGDPTSVTFTGGGILVGAICAAYTGCNTSTPIDTSQSNPLTGSTSTTLTSPSISPTGATDMLLMLYYAIGALVTWNTPSEGVIEASDSLTPNLAWVDFLLSSSGATGNQTVKISVARTSITFQIALLAASNLVGYRVKRLKSRLKRVSQVKSNTRTKFQVDSASGGFILFTPTPRHYEASLINKAKPPKFRIKHRLLHEIGEFFAVVPRRFRAKILARKRLKVHYYRRSVGLAAILLLVGVRRRPHAKLVPKHSKPKFHSTLFKQSVGEFLEVFGIVPKRRRVKIQPKPQIRRRFHPIRALEEGLAIFGFVPRHKRKLPNQYTLTAAKPSLLHKFHRRTPQTLPNLTPPPTVGIPGIKHRWRHRI